MIKEEIKREVNELVEGIYCAACRDISSYNKRFYQVYDAFYIENSLRFARTYVDCLFE